MNPYLDEDLRALAEQARRFAAERVAPGFQERDRTRVLDRGLMREMGALGFIAPELPERCGGQGTGCLAAGVVHEAIARAGTAVTDDSSAIEAMGLRPRLVEGDAANLKVTWPSDFTLAERVLAARAKGLA